MDARNSLRHVLLLAALGVCAGIAQAGTISFKLALNGASLTITNSGDSTAFFPTALTLAADGKWQALESPAGQEAPTQLSPGEQTALRWPAARAQEERAGLERLRATMVRFFDQAGVGFGQIAFFDAPPVAAAGVAANYVGGALQLSPPLGAAISATWVLWPQEEGVAGLRLASTAGFVPARAQRIEWRDAEPVRLSTGAALPAVTLIHETARGYRLQTVAAGWAGGQQQRSAWLGASREFYGLALVAAALAVFALLRSSRRRRRGAGAA